MKATLKKILHIAKLIFGVYLLLCCVALPLIYLKTGKLNTMNKDACYGMLASILMFLLIGILLLRSYAKNRVKRAKTTIANEVLYESNFYKKYKPFINIFDGYSFNGFGTKYFLYTNKAADQSFATTKWLILGFLPICPLYRNKIMSESEKERYYFPFFFKSSSQIVVLNQEPLNHKLNRYVYLLYYMFIIPLLLIPVVLLINYLTFFTRHFPGKTFWYLILLYFAWGVGVYAVSEIINKRLLLHKNY